MVFSSSASAYLTAAVVAAAAAVANGQTFTNGTNGTAPLYKNPAAPVEDRVQDLLSRMTLQEKVAQLIQGDITNFINETTGEFNASGLVWNMEWRAGQIWTGYPIPQVSFIFCECRFLGMLVSDSEVAIDRRSRKDCSGLPAAQHYSGNSGIGKIISEYVLFIRG